MSLPPSMARPKADHATMLSAVDALVELAADPARSPQLLRSSNDTRVRRPNCYAASFSAKPETWRITAARPPAAAGCRARS